jgi:hypothetical protein
VRRDCRRARRRFPIAGLEHPFCRRCRCPRDVSPARGRTDPDTSVARWRADAILSVALPPPATRRVNRRSTSRPQGARTHGRGFGSTRRFGQQPQEHRRGLTPLLIPRSQVRSLPGPSDRACIHAIFSLPMVSGEPTPVNNRDHDGCRSKLKTNPKRRTQRPERGQVAITPTPIRRKGRKRPLRRHAIGAPAARPAAAPDASFRPSTCRACRLPRPSRSRASSGLPRVPPRFLSTARVQHDSPPLQGHERQQPTQSSGVFRAIWLFVVVTGRSV